MGHLNQVCLAYNRVLTPAAVLARGNEPRTPAVQTDDVARIRRNFGLRSSTNNNQ